MQDYGTHYYTSVQVGITRSQTLYAPGSINTGTQDFRERIKSAAQSKVAEFGFGFDANKNVKLEVDGSDDLLFVDNQKDKNYGTQDCESLLKSKDLHINGLSVRPMSDVFEGTSSQSTYSS